MLKMVQCLELLRNFVGSSVGSFRPIKGAWSIKIVTLTLCLHIGLLIPHKLFAQGNEDAAEGYKVGSRVTKFSQMGTLLPTPNRYRTASGAPGPDYWQQKADYTIQVTLDDKQREIRGQEKITYYNNSPDILTYLWLQLDQNQIAPNSDTYSTETEKLESSTRFEKVMQWNAQQTFEGGYRIEYVRGQDDKPMPYTVNKTMMRVDLKQPLKPGTNIQLSIAWSYKIHDQRILGGRTGYEYFAEDDNYLYEIAHWFPRMAVYNDIDGWQHKQFLGRGEFTLPFGDYKVTITAPADFVVGSTGELQNADKVLNADQIQRLKAAETAYTKPVLIITPDEALNNERVRSDKTKSWVFHAKNVRDFAFAASRKFIWDAMTVELEGRKVLCMSYYPKEGNPLWEKYSTQAVAHTIRTYSAYTIPYPYPVAISVNGPVGGMEYPMICFNGPRPEKDSTYSDRVKYGLISVIIHEVGHNFFPMIINSDERQWTWMDEGLNSFVQFISEQQWSRDYPSRRGPAEKIVEYMKGDPSGLEPIMTNSESIIQFGNNAYGKAATALNILRETIMGRELFDFAFKEYCKRWAFKHPSPADLFRTLEDASAVDLDWFWRGWFFGVEPVDIAIDNVTWWKLDNRLPDEKRVAELKAEKAKQPRSISSIRNEEQISQTLTELQPELKDFYDSYDPLQLTVFDERQYMLYIDGLSAEEKEYLNKKVYFYQVDFVNKGGLVMPIIIEFNYLDGTKEVQKVPVEVWRKNDKKISKVFVLEKEVKEITLDPFLETADTDRNNNYYPPKVAPTRFQLYKEKRGMGGMNPMQIEQQTKKQVAPSGK